MERKYLYAGSLGIVLVVALPTLGWQSCMSAANAESQYNSQIQLVAKRWVESQPQMQIMPSSVMCIPRSFGSRMPNDLTVCRALTSGNYRVPLLCNNQGCALDHSAYGF